MPDGICIARRKVFFSGDPLIFSLQPKNRYTSYYIALYWPLPPAPLAGPDYTWLLGGNVRWFLQYLQKLARRFAVLCPTRRAFSRMGGECITPQIPPGVSALFTQYCYFLRSTLRFRIFFMPVSCEGFRTISKKVET